LRVYQDAAVGAPLFEVHLHPESQHWFIHVEEAGLHYVAALGYQDVGDGWRTISVSEPAQTPAELPPLEEPVQFVAFPLGLSLGTRLEAPAFQQPAGTPEALVSPEMVGHVEHQTAKPAGEPLLKSPLEPVIQAKTEAPTLAGQGKSWVASADGRELTPRDGNAAPWTSQQARALAQFIDSGWTKTQWPSSAEIAQLLREQARVSGPEFVWGEQPSSPAAPFGISAEQEAVSSPLGPAQAPAPEFWFNVNAELVIYGATQPDARVKIGGRTIRLRPDGTFSFRFALPDGNYHLPVEAVASHGDRREARLAFHRDTRYSGEVGQHPQSATLKPPQIEHLG
jgi:hypothetical protein